MLSSCTIYQCNALLSRAPPSKRIVMIIELCNCWTQQGNYFTLVILGWPSATTLIIHNTHAYALSLIQLMIYSMRWNSSPTISRASFACICFDEYFPRRLDSRATVAMILYLASMALVLSFICVAFRSTVRCS